MAARERKIWMVAVVVAIALMTGEARAADRGLDGLLLGAGGGALVGQAIGRDKEATLVGTAVGGMLGYMVGDSMDRAGEGYTVTRAGFHLPPPPPPPPVPSIVFSFSDRDRDRGYSVDRGPRQVCWEETVWVERRHGGYRPEWCTVCEDRHRPGHGPWRDSRYDHRRW